MAGASRTEIGNERREGKKSGFWDSIASEQIEKFTDSLYVLPSCKIRTNVLIYKHCLIHQQLEERNLGVDAG